MFDSPVHSISISVCLLLVPPGPGSDFTDEAPDEDDEDDSEEAGLSPTSSRGPIFDCFLSSAISIIYFDSVCLSAKRSFNSLVCSDSLLMMLSSIVSQGVFTGSIHITIC